jgi:hypothetical protein
LSAIYRSLSVLLKPLLIYLPRDPLLPHHTLSYALPPAGGAQLLF